MIAFLELLPHIVNTSQFSGRIIAFSTEMHAYMVNRENNHYNHVEHHFKSNFP